MVVTLGFVLLLLALICFILEAFGVGLSRLNLNALGLAFFVASFLFGR